MPTIIKNQLENCLKDILKDFLEKQNSPRSRWKMQHRINRIYRNYLFDKWIDANMVEINKADGSIVFSITIPGIWRKEEN